jgi:hypothetical protein
VNACLFPCSHAQSFRSRFHSQLEKTLAIRNAIFSARALPGASTIIGVVADASMRLLILLAFGAVSLAQESAPSERTQPQASKQINVNWLYGSYIPKDVPIKPLSGRERMKLYIHQTYTTPGIYVKTALFALHDHITDSNPEWGNDFAGFTKRLGNRQAQFIIQNSVTSAGNALVGWEPRYDRCRCNGFWSRTRHAVVRNFVTYDRTEKALRPQIMPYVGAFGSSALATTWMPGNPSWQVKGYQAVITQVFVGSGINWISEFAPEIGRILRKK